MRKPVHVFLWKLWMPTFTKLHFAGPECFPNHCWLGINSHPARSDPLLYFPPSVSLVQIPVWTRGVGSNLWPLLLNYTWFAGCFSWQRLTQQSRCPGFQFDLLLHTDILLRLHGPIIHRAVHSWAIKQISNTKAENVIKFKQILATEKKEQRSDQHEVRCKELNKGLVPQIVQVTWERVRRSVMYECFTGGWGWCSETVTMETKTNFSAD